jgi:glycogen debranching enzyme
MLQIALELAQQRSKAYEDIASKFFEHYIAVIDAINSIGGTGLWDEEEGFYFDQLQRPDGQGMAMKVRSMVGIAPLFAVSILKRDTVKGLKDFERRTKWFLQNKKQLSEYVSTANVANEEINGSQWIAIAPHNRFQRILQRVLDESEFLSPYGIRALSKYHAGHPYILPVKGNEYRVDYEPGESQSGLFGGNSNWRGPIWFPVNFLMIESLQKFHHYFGDDFRVECPTGSGKQCSLWDVSAELSRTLTHIFLRDENGRRAVHGASEKFQNDPLWRDLILFYEYFHGDTGAGLGASHQTGWTGLVSKLLEQTGE